MASVPEAFGDVNVRVVPVEIPESWNCNCFVASPSSCRNNDESFMSMAVLVDPKLNVGELIVVVPSEPDTAEPICRFVVDPETPAVPIFTAFVVALSVAPVPMFIVLAAVELPMTGDVACTVNNVLLNVVLPVNVCVRALIVASVEFAAEGNV